MISNFCCWIRLPLKICLGLIQSSLWSRANWCPLWSCYFSHACAQCLFIIKSFYLGIFTACASGNVCSIAFQCFRIFWWNPCTHLQSSSQRRMCIPLLTHGVYLLWGSLLSDNLLHTLKPPWWTQTPVSVSSTGKYCLASPACTRTSGPLVEAGTWLAWFVPSCQESQLPVGQCWKSIISFLSGFLVVYCTTKFPVPCTWLCLVYLQPSVFELHFFQVHISHNYAYLWQNDY